MIYDILAQRKQFLGMSHNFRKNRILKEIAHQQSGFVSIIALGMFAVMMILAMSLIEINMDALESIRSRNNYYKAQIMADSMMDYLQYRKIAEHEVGWNTGEVVCGFGRFEPKTTLVDGGGKSEFCKDPGLLFMATPKPGKAQKDIKVTMKIKGRADDNEKIKTAKCGSFNSSFNNSCYVIPDPGTGTAGEGSFGMKTNMNCDRYKPSFIGDYAASATIPAELANGSNQLDQLNYSCNWNKLQFGSSQFDRVAIPLYYDSAKVGEESTIVNSFYKTTAYALKAENILVRLRTPCVPCGRKMANGALRVCDDKVRDETVCKNGERYVLNVDYNPKTEDDDIVVQWLLNGECDDDGDGKWESCGMIPIGDKKNYEDNFSAFYESKINDVTNEQNGFNYIMIENLTITYDTNIYPKTASLLSTNKGKEFPIKLPTMKNPVLTLFLSKPLLTAEKWGNIPYLEYQILTDKPISNSKSILEVDVVVDTNGFTKTLTKEVHKQLIDFAIHD